ncbi:glycosyltransferase [Sulfitobacter pseudonitzschiae]|uniref:Glycosyltransferase n=1 Tax=Pseudosulfitobacter pseudonitzschiae TaxID=1402135 RepID=A0A9Q2S307_9RHOB|nr:glycosyltransferase [Pseudosulfitobacter pseudonitzschiae]MBM2295141.1 glycosyltransferase [Pseudosulfitobacter pseudonitzschiae]MBM2300056.1 glycosyltransferase [Pseudosulfitobacter pseudonitzschiae]MBM2304974.1 glycosyltransferase [Pseudosulfitobacter pseudonitzschiae]MBM2314752.1 glycosyltransferase [Pseudosulfitobacter pseudonitzschiae]MBM2319663.1 glycosyltransferase [Pseudosulfitobacter pseudonitzschiae]
MPANPPHIHWVSPLPPAETDIAHYTYRILPELTSRSNITLWTDAPSWNRGLAEYCRVQSLDPSKIKSGEMRGSGETTAAGDVIFVNMGNSSIFHAGFLQLVRRIPTVVILHDLALQEMYFQTVSRGMMDLDEYLDEIEQWYGKAGRQQARLCWEGRLSVYDFSSTRPGFEILMNNAVAIVTHTSAAHSAVTKRGFVPAYQLELPYKARSTYSSERLTSGPLRLMQFGYIGPNRRLENILEALANLDSNVDFVFDICGKLWDPERIKLLCSRLGLDDKVKFNGFVSEATLDDMLDKAHLVFNLRNPTMGEASGSQLRIWNAGAASVVTDDGWYHEVADEAVFRIPKENEVSSIKALLQQISKDRHVAMFKGECGRHQLINKHDPRSYADCIVQVAQNFTRDAHDAVLANAARRLIGEDRLQADLLRASLSSLF